MKTGAVKNTWRTKDGRVLQISKMDTDHLRNTINFLRRQIAGAENSLEIFDFFDDDWFPSRAEREVRAFVKWAESKIMQMQYELRKRDTSWASKIFGGFK